MRVIKIEIILIIFILTGINLLIPQNINKEDIKLSIQNGHSDKISTIAYSSDNQYFITGSFDRTIKFWNKDGCLLKTLTGHLNWLEEIKIILDGEILLSSDDYEIKIWDLKTSMILFNLEQPEGTPHGNVVISSDKKFVVSYVGSVLCLWSLKNNKIIFKAVIPNISLVNFSKDNKYIICNAEINSENILIFIDINTKRITKKENLFSNKISGNALFSNDGNYIFYKSNSNLVYRSLDGKTIKVFDSISQEIWGMAISQDNNFLLTGTRKDNIVRMWTNEGNLIKSYKVESSPESVSISPDNKIIIAGLMDGDLKIWNTNNNLESTITDNSYGKLFSAKYSPDGNFIVCSSGNNKSPWYGKILLLNNRFEIINTFGDNNMTICKDVNFTQDSKFIISATRDSINIYEINGGLVRKLQIYKTNTYTKFRISSDGKYILTTGNNIVKLIDFKTGDIIKEFEGYSNSGLIDFNPDSKSFAIQNNSKIEIYDISCKLIRSIAEGYFFNDAMIYSPDGKYIAIDGIKYGAKYETGGIIILDVTTGKTVKKFLYKDNYDWIRSLTFSPDGKKIIAGSYNGNIKIWDFKDNKLRKVLTGHNNEINSVSLSPDGKYIISTSDDTTLKVWNSDSYKSLTLLPIKDNNWILYDDKDNYYCTEKAKCLIKFIKGYNIYNESDFSKYFFNREIINSILY